MNSLHDAAYATSAPDYREPNDNRPADLDEQHEQNVLEIPLMQTAVTLLLKEAQTSYAAGDVEKAENAAQRAREMGALLNTTSRMALQNRHLFAHRYFDAAKREDWEAMEAHAIEAIKSKHADEAVKIACARAVIETDGH